MGPQRHVQPAAACVTASSHEIVVHCADRETNAHGRIRYLAAEPDPPIVGYDQAAWARIFDHHARPMAPAPATIDAVRANTAALIRASLDPGLSGQHLDPRRSAQRQRLVLR